MLHIENNNNNLNFENYENQESELLIDNKVTRGVPTFPKLLNNVTISKGSGFCNFFCKNLFLGNSEENNQIKQLLKKEGLDKFSFLSNFYINSFVVDNLSLSVFQDYGSFVKTPIPILKDLKIIWKKEHDDNQKPTKEIESLKQYVNLKSDYLQIQKLSMLKINDTTTTTTSTIKHLEIRRLNNSKLNFIETPLPNSLTKLTIGEGYEYPLTIDMVHDGIKCLNIGYKWNFNISNNTTPTSLTQLTLGDCYNQPFTNESLPNNIKILKLGRDFNQFSSLENLNPNIHTLKFNNNFNNLISCELKLPNSITTLEFGDQFNQEINENTFINCHGLKNLKFGKSFSKVLSLNNIPNFIEKLIIPFKTKLLITDQQLFNKFYSIENQLKLNNNHLRINCKHILNNDNNNNNNNNISEFKFPINCNSVTFEDNSYIEYVNRILPNSIKYLEFGENFRNEKSPDQFNKRLTIRARDIPRRTTHLSIQSKDVILDYIPSNITHLKTCSNYSHPINILPFNHLVSLKTSLSNVSYLKKTNFTDLV
ncbi:hypothetical protein ACTFIY_006426 [Dictyostelium cf. discoideum]